MCGILSVHGLTQEEVISYRPTALAMTKTLRHRGPDWTGVWESEDTIMCHERLAICGVDSGAQPLIDDSEKIALAVNGEIYNHKALRKGLKNTGGVFKTHSDCEVILHMYKEMSPEELCNKLDGMWAFVLVDTSVSPSRVIAGRDPIGITVLYQGWKSSAPNLVYFASELKALKDECDKIVAFPPGSFYDSKTGKIERYYKPSWMDGSRIPKNVPDLDVLRTSLETAVKKRLMSEVPYGVLLSGGLDSSLIAAIMVRETEKIAKAQYKLQQESSSLVASPHMGDALEDTEANLATWPRVHSFAIGLVGSPDLIAARTAASHLKTHHHEHTFTVQEGLDALSDVVYHLETYDVTTLRASTPMYLLSRKIKAMGVKMVLSGEGSDEILGGYLYFCAAPSAAEFHTECVDRVKSLHLSDCLRANKSTMAWGLEARVPFLDKEFLDVAMNIDPEYKVFSKGKHTTKDAEGRPKMEKYILRKAFDCAPGGKPYLPDEILWRQKEQFSDGVGYSWIDGMKAYAETFVSDADFASRAERWSRDTPDTKEAYMIRVLFEKHFPSDAAASTAMRWVPKQAWGVSSDPSGRAVKIHEAHKEV